jgi:uncharacterized phage protein gp47/JayE
MFEEQTSATIFARMLLKIPDNVDKREGSIAHDMLMPSAVELAQAYIELNNVLNFGFGDTTYGEYLDRRVSEVGLTRKLAAKANGYVNFYGGTVGTFIPSGTLLQTADGIQFITTDNVTLASAGNANNIPIIAVLEGSTGNVPIGAIVQTPGSTGFLVNNTAPTSGGVDIENDEDLRKRYFQRVRTFGAAGSIGDYIRLAMEIPGIADARVFSAWDGPTTVKIVLLGTDRRTPSATLIARTAAHIETNRPLGAQVTVVGATEIAINVHANLTLKAGGVMSNAIAQITANVVEYLKTLAFTDQIIRYTKIADCVLNAADVLDYANLTVNGSNSNVQIADDQVAVIGAVVNT